MKRNFFLIIILIIGQTGFAQIGTPGKKSSLKTIDWGYMDTTVKPGDDFYRYANGNWMDTVQFQPGQTAITTLSIVRDNVRDQINTIIQHAVAQESIKSSDAQIIGDFYKSGMDTLTMEQLGITPAKPFLNRIASAKNIKDILRFDAYMSTFGYRYLIGNMVFTDVMDNQKNYINIFQGALGLGSKDLYLKKDESTLRIQHSYIRYLTTLLKLSGESEKEAASHATKILELEKTIAAAHPTDEEENDMAGSYKNFSVSETDAQLSNISFASYLGNLNVHTDRLIFYAFPYIKKMDTLLTTIPVDMWKTYYKAQILADFSGLLSSPFREARFVFNSEQTGNTSRRPREQMVIDEINGSLDEFLGKLYVAQYFTEETKSKVNELIKNLQRGFEHRLQNNTWMTDSTRAKALEKIRLFTVKTGYPDKWKEYEHFDINSKTYFNNILSITNANQQLELNKVGQAVNKGDWIMTPQTVNAHVDMTQNAIVFPAGILQPPYFDANVEDAVNYAYAGMVIGHEMSHNFDNNGALFDKDGKMNNWWTNEDFEKFKEKTEQVIKLYNSFVLVDTLHVNGVSGAGENIGDMGGLAVAYQAFMLSQQKNPSPVINGFTPEQRFFIAYAQQWKAKATKETEMLSLKTDHHSPQKFRTIGPLMNFEPFYKAFNIQSGDKMYLDEKDRIVIW